MNIKSVFIGLLGLSTIVITLQLAVYYHRRRQNRLFLLTSVDAEITGRDITNDNDSIHQTHPIRSNTSIVDRRFNETAERIHRLNLLKQFCSSRNHRYRKSRRHIVHNERLKFAYCKVGKVASSAWSGLLKKACGDFSSGSQSKRMPELKGLGKGLFKFLFVRHPFDRLLSAFNSKFKRRKTVYIKRLAPKILKKYRTTLAESGDMKISDLKNITFAEFIRYLVDQKHPKSDFHWSPQVEICPPCRIKYDYIGHYETLYDDSAYILSKLRIKNRFSDAQLGKLKTWEQRVRKAYADIPLEHRKKLKKIYRFDFEAFGYDPDII